MVFAILNRMVGAGLPEKVTLEERLLGGEGANHANMWGKSIPGGGICKCKGLEALGELWLLHRVPRRAQRAFGHRRVMV